MLTIEKSPKHVLAIRLSGTVEKTEIETMAKAFRDKVAAHDRLGLLVDLTEWSDITGDAIVEDVKFELGLLGTLSRFPRMAIVSDKQFVKAIVTCFGSLVPMIDVKVFVSDEYPRALAFASDVPAPTPAGKRSITLIETGDPKLIGYEIDGMVTKDDVERVVSALQQAFETYEKIDLLVRMKGYTGFDPSILGQQSLISVKLSAIRHVRRYAVVGAKDWMTHAVGMFASMLPIEIRFFNAGQENDAWAWLKS